ncbi:Ig-like domain-containing protein [Paenibacillus chartarius]|uniref:Ig-like domain-containing protein n=1 Tax=Paenibacillus chartarius TaxID=747481 RepID=A0ABV6DM19_9BACL
MKPKLPNWLVATMVLTTLAYPNGTAMSAQTANPLRTDAQSDWRFADIALLEAARQEAIQEAVRHGWISGDLNGQFRPTDTLTRQELAKLLTVALNIEPKQVTESSFADVEKDAWGIGYIEAVKSAGLMVGDEMDAFRPNAPVTREELAVVLVRALQDRPAANTDRLIVADRADISDWALGYVQRALERGLLELPAGFKPKQQVERQEIAEVLLRSFAENHDYDLAIDQLQQDRVLINGVAYSVSDSLKALFQEKNHAILQGARLRFEADNQQIERIKSLLITKGGTAPSGSEAEFSKNLLLDGGDVTIDGSVKIAADFVSLKRLTVTGNLEITKELQHDFYMDHVIVTGDTIVNGGDTNTVVFNDSMLTGVQVNKTDVRVESLGNTSVEEMTVSSNATIVGDSGVTISKVTLTAGAQQVDMQANVEALEIKTSGALSLTGSGNIGALKVNSAAPVTLNSQAKVGTLSVSNTQANLTVGTNVQVQNLVLPDGVAASNVVQNFGAVQTQVSNINGTVNPAAAGPSNSAPEVVAPISDKLIQLADGPLTIDISGVFLDRDYDNLTIKATSRNVNAAAVPSAVVNNQLVITPKGAGNNILIQLSASDGTMSVTTRFNVTVNVPPVAKPIPEQIVTLGAGPKPLTVYVKDKPADSYFTDSTWDTLTFSAVSENPAIAGASISGGSLMIDPIEKGKTNIIITANDGKGGSVTGTVPVLVNVPPEVVVRIGDRMGTIGNPDVTVDLSNVFRDLDGDSLTYEAASQDDTSAKVTVDGNVLKITPQAAGTPVITVTAKDGKGGAVTETFAFTVNRPPEAENIQKQTVTIGNGAGTVSLPITDKDGDTLTISADSQNEGVVTAEIVTAVDGSKQLRLTPVAAGTAEVAVTADDGRGGKISKTFEVLVNRAPQQKVSTSLTNVTIGNSDVSISLPEYFEDQDHDTLSYEAIVENPSLASASISGSGLKLTAISAGTTNVLVTAKDGKGGTTTIIFPVLVNQSPELTGSLANLKATVGVDTRQVNLAGLFADPDQDVLTVTATSSDKNIAEISQTGDIRTVTPVHGGTATITVTADDSKGGVKRTTFTVEVNESPTVSAQEQVLQLTDTEKTVDLNTLFTDSDGDALSFIIDDSGLSFTVDNEPVTVAKAVYSGSQLILKPEVAGIGKIHVTADDNRGGTVSSDIQVRVNRAPQAAGDPLSSQQVTTIGSTPLTVELDKAFTDPNGNLTAAFTDPDGNRLKYSAVVLDSSLATAEVNDNVLKITGIAPGTTTVNVTADDGYNGTAQSSFSLLVNQAPAVVKVIGDQLTTLGTGDVIVDISQVFSDADGDALTVIAMSQDPSVATVSMSGNQLTIHPVAGGSTTIDVTAVDNKGGTVTESFTLRVNRAPTVSGIPAQTIALEKGEKTVDVSSFFQDADGDSLTFEAVSSNDAIAEVSMTGTQLKITPVALGIATVTLTVYDGFGGKVTGEMPVTIQHNQAPQTADSIADKTVYVGSPAEIDVSGVFTDADLDALTYTASSADETVTTVTYSGSKLTLTALSLGTSVITVSASDGMAAPVSMTFTVTAKNNSAPAVVGSVPLQVIGGSVQPNQFSIAHLFNDQDGDSLTYTVEAADSNLVTPTINGDTLTLASGSGGYGQTSVTVTADDGNGKSTSTTIEVLAARVVRTKQIAAIQGTADASYQLSADFPTATSFTKYKQVKGSLTQDQPETINGTVFTTVPGAIGSTESYWIVAPDQSAVFVDVTVREQQGAGAFFAEYTRGPDGRIVLEMFNKDESTLNYTVVGYRYNKSTNMMEIMKNREIPPTPNANVGNVYPGTLGIVINHTFYDLMDITPVQWYQGELDMTGDGRAEFVVCAFELVKDGQVVDVIGDKNWTPGLPEPLPNLGTMIRKKGIVKSSTTYNPEGEWDFLPLTYANLFSHTP